MHYSYDKHSIIDHLKRVRKRQVLLNFIIRINNKDSGYNGLTVKLLCWLAGLLIEYYAYPDPVFFIIFFDRIYDETLGWVWVKYSYFKVSSSGQLVAYQSSVRYRSSNMISVLEFVSVLNDIDLAWGGKLSVSDKSIYFSRTIDLIILKPWRYLSRCEKH
ncbi:hypothetical protein BDC45DRAFT_529949 [Circinella umbellata]|nr:hypothetical protein BDC45DRAFT_529949 [Circinella umbellata]